MILSYDPGDGEQECQREGKKAAIWMRQRTGHFLIVKSPITKESLRDDLSHFSLLISHFTFSIQHNVLLLIRLSRLAMQKRRSEVWELDASERQRGNHFRHFPLSRGAYRVTGRSPEESVGGNIHVQRTFELAESSLKYLRHSETSRPHARLDLKARTKTD